MPSAIVLTGAPRRSTLHPSPLLAATHLLPAFRELDEPAPREAHHVCWRILPAKPAPLHSGLSQPSQLPSPRRLPAAAPPAELVSADSFLARSFASYDEQPSSPLPSPSSFTAGSNASSSFNASSTLPTLPLLPPLNTLTDLSELPSPAHLDSISPQTMSISTLVGIISITQPQPVTTRYGTTLLLITLVVGDETSAGFKIDVWLPSPSTHLTAAAKDFKATIESLRLQDVVVIENISLRAWKGKVYAATMRKDRTKIRLVHRLQCVDRAERKQWRINWRGGRGDQQLAKLVKVVRWLREFVDDGRRPRKRKRVKKSTTGEVEEEEEEAESLPDDTQDS